MAEEPAERQCAREQEESAGDRFEGPAIVEQFDATAVVLGGQTVKVEADGVLVIEE